MENAAVKSLSDDALHTALREGRASKEDQEYAARWITWLSQFVPQDRYESRRDGYEKD